MVLVVRGGPRAWSAVVPGGRSLDWLVDAICRVARLGHHSKPVCVHRPGGGGTPDGLRRRRRMDCAGMVGLVRGRRNNGTGDRQTGLGWGSPEQRGWRGRGAARIWWFDGVGWRGATRIWWFDDVGLSAWGWWFDDTKERRGSGGSTAWARRRGAGGPTARISSGDAGGSDGVGWSRARVSAILGFGDVGPAGLGLLSWVLVLVTLARDLLLVSPAWALFAHVPCSLLFLTSESLSWLKWRVFSSPVGMDFGEFVGMVPIAACFIIVMNETSSM